jgi:THAP4-like, heme-binding beta-barrel domain
MVDLHEQLAPLAGLLGTWRGRGTMTYPTIETVEYQEEVTFAHVGKPFLAYAQRTRHAATDAPLHAETGYWRAPAPGRCELVLAHPTGIVEVYEGTVDGAVFDLATVTVATTSTAKDVRALHRRFLLSEDTLSYEVHMAAVGVPLTLHLAAELHR